MTHQEPMETLLTHPKDQTLNPTYRWELLKVEKVAEKKHAFRAAENKAHPFKGQVYALKFTLSF